MVSGSSPLSYLPRPPSCSQRSTTSSVQKRATQCRLAQVVFDARSPRACSVSCGRLLRPRWADATRRDAQNKQVWSLNTASTASKLAKDLPSLPLHRAAILRYRARAAPFLEGLGQGVAKHGRRRFNDNHRADSIALRGEIFVSVRGVLSGRIPAFERSHSAGYFTGKPRFLSSASTFGSRPRKRR